MLLQDQRERGEQDEQNIYYRSRYASCAWSANAAWAACYLYNSLYSIQELYELQTGSEPIMLEEEDDGFVKQMIGELIAFFEESFNKKKIEKALTVPWRKSPPCRSMSMSRLMVVFAIDNEEYGEQFDPLKRN